MIGDILIIAEKHKLATAEIMKKIESVDKRKLVIAVSGESGSGKSEIALLLRRELKSLGLKAKALHSDNYYITGPNERTDWRLKHGISESVGLGEYRWELLHEHIKAFRDGEKEVKIPYIDIVSGDVEQLVISFDDTDVLIVEGLYGINADVDFKALIGLTYHETKNMQTLRGKEPVNQTRAQILEAEHQAVLSIKPKADLIITREMMGL